MAVFPGPRRDLHAAKSDLTAPRAVPEALRRLYEHQAVPLEESAQVLTAQADLMGRRIALATLPAEQKRQEAALTDGEPAQAQAMRQKIRTGI